MKDKLEKAINWLKDAYLAVIDWEAANLHKSFWIAVALIVAGLFV